MSDTLALKVFDLSELGDDLIVTMASDETKWKVLGKIDIRHEDHPDATPLVAWRDAMADHNGIDRATLDPEKGGCLDLAFASEPVRRFVWFLA